MASRFLVFSFFGVVLARSSFPSFRLWIPKAVQRSALCRSRRELSNEYLFATFGFDTAENEPCKVCPLSVYRLFPQVQAAAHVPRACSTACRRICSPAVLVRRHAAGSGGVSVQRRAQAAAHRRVQVQCCPTGDVLRVSSFRLRQICGTQMYASIRTTTTRSVDSVSIKC